MLIILYAILALLFFILVHKHDARLSGPNYPQWSDLAIHISCGLFWPGFVLFVAIDTLTED